MLWNIFSDGFALVWFMAFSVQCVLAFKHLPYELKYQACKLAPDIRHLSGKFEGFDWRILSLTGHVDWALPLWREIKNIFSVKKDKRYVRPNGLHVRSNLVPGLTYDRLTGKSYLQAWNTVFNLMINPIKVWNLNTETVLRIYTGMCNWWPR